MGWVVGIQALRPILQSLFPTIYGLGFNLYCLLSLLFIVHLLHVCTRSITFFKINVPSLPIDFIPDLPLPSHSLDPEA